MTTQHPDIVEIVRNDPRYLYEAYEFVFDALGHAQRLYCQPTVDAEPTTPNHVSGHEILHAACDLARQEFGLLAKVVFRHWGIHRTDDLGEVVFNLIESGLLSKTENDHRTDFQNVFDLERALGEGFAIPMSEIAWGQRGVL